MDRHRTDVNPRVVVEQWIDDSLRATSTQRTSVHPRTMDRQQMDVNPRVIAKQQADGSPRAVSVRRTEVNPMVLKSI